jgi:hypothetical protein
MMNYDSKEIVTLLDAPTISALFKIYDIGYRVMALRLRCSKANITYKMRTDSWYQHERQMLYDLFKSHGCDDTFIILLNTMVNKQKKDVK